jgi:hypothetical protein
MFVLAAIPPLWFHVMDPKVMDWAQGDLSKVNLLEAKRDRLEHKWGTVGRVSSPRHASSSQNMGMAAVGGLAPPDTRLKFLVLVRNELLQSIVRFPPISGRSAHQASDLTADRQLCPILA